MKNKFTLKQTQGHDTTGRHHVPLDHSELTVLSAAADRLFQVCFRFLLCLLRMHVAPAGALA